MNEMKETIATQPGGVIFKRPSEEAKRTWKVDCLVCETTVDLDVSDYKIISTDQCAEFIQKPLFVCCKCGTNCRITLQQEKKNV
jgi:hypothetical protein